MEENSGAALREEVARFFPQVDRDTLLALSLSSDDVATVLASLSLPAPLAPPFPVRVAAGTALALDAPTDVVGPTGAKIGFFSRLFVCERFGNYRFHQREEGGKKRNFEVLTTSATYDYATASDDVSDALFFLSWDGTFDESLENALVNLVAATEDTLPNVLEKLANLSALMMGTGAGEEMRELSKSIAEDLTKALTEHSAASIGRLHSSLNQLISVSRMMHLPPELIAAIRQFEVAKNRTTAVRDAVQKASIALDRYGGELMTKGKLSQNDNAIQSLLRAKMLLENVLKTGDLSHLWSYNSAAQIENMGNDPLNPHSLKVAFFPILLLESIQNPSASRFLRNCYTETLAGNGVLMIGSLLGHRTSANSPKSNAEIIHGIVSSGFGYAGAGSGGPIVALHGHRRACIFLQEEEKIIHDALLARRKDCCRQLRKMARECPLNRLQFRANFGEISNACKLLREHHRDSNWADLNIEAAWNVLKEEKKFCVLELHLIEEGEEGREKKSMLIAADFCHLICGGSVYVATRFSDRKSKLSPGFFLALLSCKILKNLKYSVWDLGQTDSNPMMNYKASVAKIMERPIHWQRFCELDFFSLPPAIANGVLVERVTESDLLEVVGEKK